MWNKFAENTSKGLRLFATLQPNHPVWSTRPYKVFLYTSDDVRRVVAYINDNPRKDNLIAQEWPFVTLYDGWPARKIK